MLTLATFARTVKKNTINPAKSDEKFLNELLEGYVQAARIKARDGGEFHLDKVRTSKLLSGKAEVPGPLLAGLERYGVEDATADQMDAFVQDFADPNCIGALTDEVLGLLASDDPARPHLEELATNLTKFLARALLLAIANPNVPTNGGALWSRGTGVLAWREGDIFELAPKDKSPAIVVIPVNTSFDAHVTRKKEGVTAPLVSPGTLHGKWLERMAASGADESEIAARVLSDLSARAVSGDARGRFPIGTVAVIEHRGVTYYLLALSDFDDDNRAQCDAEGVRTALASLADFYDRNGQGEDVYLPLIGTGMSRAGLSYRESLDLIVNTFAGPGAFLAGRATVVVTPEAASSLGLGE